MIKLNGIYKLKKIKGISNSENFAYKVLAMNEDKTMVGCERINCDNPGERFVFMIECLLDPEKPNDIYFGEIIKKNNCVEMIRNHSQ